MKHYYGLTLGPIYGTLSQVRKTRELWGGSFFFSLLMKNIVQAVHQHQAFTILLPYPTVKEEAKDIGVGLFPDRMILEAPADSGDEIYQLCIAALTQISGKIASEMGTQEEKLISYFKEYVQLYLVTKEFEGPAAAIMGLNTLMDSAELQTKYQHRESGTYLFDYLEKFSHKADSHFIKEAFGNRDKAENRILSLPEIACMGLEKYSSTLRKTVFEPWWRQESKKQKEDEFSLYAWLRDNHSDLFEQLRTYHRYIAVVYADGDNVGKTVENLKDEAEVESFSKSLLEFGMNSETLISTYGGKLVYAGGDDLLFFAPVKSATETIFGLCGQLDALFRDTMRTEDTTNPPSLSFGVSISYYKFPLFEALEAGQRLLFQTAKKFPDPDNRQKNALAFQLLKHSGQTFGQTFAMNGLTYGSFQDILIQELETEGRFLSSIMFMIEQQKAVFDAIGQMESQAGRSIRFEQVIDNNFDKTAHQGPVKVYLDSVKQLVKNAYSDYPWTEKNKGKEARKAIYSALRTIHFLKQAYDE